MALDAMKKLKLSQVQEQALATWIAARREYSAESKLFQRIRRQIPRSMEDCTPAQIVLLYKAKARYKEACKRHYLAQLEYNSASGVLGGPLNTQEQVADAMQQLLAIITGTPSAAIRDTRAVGEDEVLKARFGAVEQNPMLSAIADAARTRHAPPEDEIDFSEDLGDGSADSEAAPAPEDDSNISVVLSPMELIQRFGIPEKDA